MFGVPFVVFDAREQLILDLTLKLLKAAVVVKQTFTLWSAPLFETWNLAYGVGWLRNILILVPFAGHTRMQILQLLLRRLLHWAETDQRCIFTALFLAQRGKVRPFAKHACA